MRSNLDWLPNDIHFLSIYVTFTLHQSAYLQHHIQITEIVVLSNLYTNHPTFTMDPGLNSLLQWGIENSAPGRNPDEPVSQPRGLSADALRSLMGGPSDADLMKQAMAIIASSDPEITHDSKMTAFDNFEQLVENIDNANNMEPLGLWTPMIRVLDCDQAELRMMAAWCIGTAVQNNVKAQERFLALNGVEKLVKVAVGDTDKATRKKAVYALSSAVRNYQPAINVAVKELPKEIVGGEKVDAEDMDAIDKIMGRLRER
jgi:hsp70-interacting protein